MNELAALPNLSQLPLSERKKLADLYSNLAKHKASLASQAAEQLEHLVVAERLEGTMTVLRTNIASIEEELNKALREHGLIP